MPNKSKNHILDHIEYLPVDIQYKILTHYLISKEVEKYKMKLCNFE